MKNRFSYSLVATLLAASMLTACGRAGVPLSPYEAKVKQAKEDKTPAKDRPFILDGLLQ